MADLTVVMMNWLRPKNVMQLVKKYQHMRSVVEVIVIDPAPWQAQTRPFKSTAGCPVRVIKFNYDPGLATRLAVASLARTDLVVLADDDIGVEEQALDVLVAARGAGICGFGGRIPHFDGTYTRDKCWGRVPIVLNRVTVTTPEFCAGAAPLTVRMAEEIGGEPFGNGEDICHSFFAMKQTGELNRAVNISHMNLGYDSPNAISVRNPNHLQHRSRVVAWCRKNIFDERTLINIQPLPTPAPAC